MSKVTVKRPGGIELGLGGGKRFPAGTHEFSDEDMAHVAIPGLAASGDIIIHSDVPEQLKELSYPAASNIPAGTVKELDYSSQKVKFDEGGKVTSIGDAAEGGEGNGGKEEQVAADSGEPASVEEKPVKEKIKKRQKAKKS